MTEDTQFQSDTPYRVECDVCDTVTFDEIDIPNKFGNEIAATWYAGYHSGKVHPDSDYQEALPTEMDEE